MGHGEFYQFELDIPIHFEIYMSYIWDVHETNETYMYELYTDQPKIHVWAMSYVWDKYEMKPGELVGWWVSGVTYGESEL